MLAGLGAVAAGRLPAEVSATPRDGGRVDTLIMTDAGITDGIDPIPGVWHVYRPLSADWVLNASGDERGDGRPHVAYHRVSGAPTVVWAYNQGASHDIALASWQGSGWGPTELVTSTPQDEVDPRVFVRPDGKVYVVWWTDGQDPRVELTSRDEASDSWAPPVRVTALGEPGRRPSVAHAGGATWIAYERNATASAFNSNEVAVRRQVAAGPFNLVRLAETTYDGNVDPLLHVEHTRFWMDWRYSTDQYAYSEINDPTGSGTNLETWTDPSWIGIESVRLRIAHLVAATEPPATEVEGGPLP